MLNRYTITVDVTDDGILVDVALRMPDDGPVSRMDPDEYTGDLASILMDLGAEITREARIRRPL